MAVERQYRRRTWLTLPRVLLFLLAATACVPVGITVLDARRARAAAVRNAPDVLVDQPTSLTFPDPLHVTVPDGRTFRLAHVIAPEPGSASYAPAEAVAARVLAFGGNQRVGLRTVRRNAGGETLVELWALQPAFGSCGNAMWAERRAARIPRWRNQTSRMVASGHFRLEPQVSDRELRAMEASARRDGLGVWNDPAALREFLDPAELLSVLERSAIDGKPRSRDQRLEAAELLMRLDAVGYAPRLLKIVTDPAEKDVFVRIALAQRLQAAGDWRGTAYLVDALRNPDGPHGLDVPNLNTVAASYQRLWKLPTAVPVPALVVQHYESFVPPATP